MYRMSLVGNIFVYRFGRGIPKSGGDKLSVIIFKGNLHPVDSLLLKYPSSRELLSYTCCLTFSPKIFSALAGPLTLKVTCMHPNISRRHERLEITFVCLPVTYTIVTQPHGHLPKSILVSSISHGRHDEARQVSSTLSQAGLVQCRKS